MPRKQLKTVKGFILALLTSAFIFPSLGFLGFLVIYYWEESTPRKPAEYIPEKKYRPIEINKMRMPLSVTLSRELISGDSDIEITRIVATIRANQEIDKTLEYEWILPSDESFLLEQGQLKGQIDGLNLGDIATVFIDVKGFVSTKSLTISLQASYYSSDDRKIVNSAIISSNE